MVTLAWSQAGSASLTLANLCWKLKRIKSDLKLLNKENFSKIQERVSDINCLLQTVQVQALSSPSPRLFQEERDLHQKWLFLREIEESFFRQKSRINWLREGDLNTAYFFKICQTRASYNSIRSFITITGVVIQDPLEMSSHAVNHFKAVLGPIYLPIYVYSPASWIQTLTPFRVTDQERCQMVSIPTAAEIKKIMFRLNPNKALGPDGLTSGFFKHSWEIIGAEVTGAITQFFGSAFLPSAANTTILSLVPKHPGASQITDHRPISCLNTIYKVISRLLVQRLKPILSSFILPSQTAFVKGRLILENSVLAGELVNGYHKNKEPKRLTIKVDIAKAFDTLSWDFLFNCLEGLNLPPLNIRWLRACICTPSYMVGYNGTVNDYFKGRRGLRQGDPLSPYLFVMAMNCLSLMLKKAAEEGDFGYHSRCESTRLTHLCFADDLLIFTESSLSSFQKVLQVLREFEMRSGLAISVQKSCFFSSGLTQAEVEAIQVSTGMAQGSLPIRYLGVPLCTKKLSIANCEQLIQLVKQRLSSWTVKTLSFAGRLLLIKTVIAGITNFWCALFILPKACIKRINTLCSTFLWKGEVDSRNTARVAWDTVTRPKEEGGLGIHDLLTWNKATVLKLIWLLFFRAGSVWVAWFKEEVLQGDLSNFWTTKPSRHNSWLANKLLKSKALIYNWIKARVGNGLTCRFWTDNWTPYGSLDAFLKQRSSSRLGIGRNATIGSLWHQGSWRLPPARLENQLLLHTYLTTVELTDEEDVYEWELDGRPMLAYET